MHKHYIFHLLPEASIEDALAELCFIANPYYIEDAETGITTIGGWSNTSLPKNFKHVVFDHLADDAIDWTAQWEAFAPSYYDGLVHVELAANIPPLLLKPGAGFGDLSHPTTRLMLAMMASHAHKTTAIDIGCGSGILSLAAVILGADQAIGIDIDDQALAHARQNAELNHLTSQAHFTHKLNDLPQGSLLILMNMISSEQQQAWQACSFLHHHPATIITSGIPQAERDHYLAFATQWG